MMTKKMYKVWMELLKDPGKWMDIRDMAKNLNMTANQVSALISHMDNSMIDRDEGFVRFSGTYADSLNMKRKVTMECFSLSEDDLHGVRDALSSAGAISVSDICNETGLSIANVINILRIMDDLETIVRDSVRLYYISPAPMTF